MDLLPSAHHNLFWALSEARQDERATEHCVTAMRLYLDYNPRHPHLSALHADKTLVPLCRIAADASVERDLAAFALNAWSAVPGSVKDVRAGLASYANAARAAAVLGIHSRYHNNVVEFRRLLEYADNNFGVATSMIQMGEAALRIRDWEGAVEWASRAESIAGTRGETALRERAALLSDCAALERLTC
jgi:hypothetical protein